MLINCEGVIILSTGETTGEIFEANAHQSYFMLFAYFYSHHVLDKVPTWKLFKLTLMEKSQAEKSPWLKKMKKNSSERDKKNCCDAMLPPGNLDLLSQPLGGAVVPLVCGFIRRDNLPALGELFTNLYKRKCRIMRNTSTLSEFIGCADSTSLREADAFFGSCFTRRENSYFLCG